MASDSSSSDALPEGFLLTTEFLTPGDESALVDFAGRVAFGTVRMHGVTAKRRVAQFGYRYAFESYRLTEGPPIPPELLPARTRAAALAHIEPYAFSEALVTEYPPGAGIGWHRDAPHFGIVAGISFGAPCRMRFRPVEGRGARSIAVDLPPRSIYLLTGAARQKSQHMIPPVRETRWSITFRTLRREPKA